MQGLNRNLLLSIRLASRYLLVWLADALSIGVAALVLPGIYFIREAHFWYLNPFVVALEFALLNVLVRPIFVILLLPINFVTLGLTTLILNSALFYLMGVLVGSFVIESFLSAVVGLLILSTVNTLLESLMHLEDDYSFFSAVMDRLSKLTKPKRLAIKEKGLVIVQIDGLSFSTLKRAIHRGKMPFVGDVLSRGRYACARWFSGLPSQTSSVQAGIFYGNSFDIPGFRWYDKAKKREVVSSNSSDMNDIDIRFSGEEGALLKDGTCVNTLLHGGARKKLVTLSAILEKDFRRRKGELEDFAIFSLHPFLYNRTIVLMIWDFLVDRLQSFIAAARRKEPRVKRGIKFSFLRSVGNAFLRESTSYFVREDIVRGIPVIYVNYIGYDIVAHHAGPHSWDALSTLTGIDRQIKKINKTIIKKAAKRYDLIILSDHGQSRSIPFESLYGKSLYRLIEEKLKAPLIKTSYHSAEKGYFATLLSEIHMVEKAYGTRPIMRSRKTLEKIRTKVWDEPAQQSVKAAVAVCCSGNLAHIYFTENTDRITTEMLLQHYPALLDALTSHPGIGFVITMNEKGEIVVMGKKGMRLLRAGKVEGEDPLLPYDRNKMSFEELEKLCEYPHSGDVILNGSVLPDGGIVTFEDQLGTHGGLGGDQTEAFILYPKRYGGEKEQINNPREMHHFLKGMLHDNADKQGERRVV